VPDVARCVTMDLKQAGNRVYALGTTAPELGGSLYLEHLGRRGGSVPKVDLERAPRLFAALHRAIQSGLVASCHDLSEGGLAVAAAEMAFGGDLGLTLDLAQLPAAAEPRGSPADPWRLFSESCSRFLVEVRPADGARFEALFAGLACAAVGEVKREPRLSVRGTDGSTVLELPVDELRRAFQSGFQG